MYLLSLLLFARSLVCILCAEPVLIIISFDGFRYDYLNKSELPHLRSLLKDGVVAEEGIEPRFITKTFPNHQSIATGLYEEDHGIVANEFFDPLFNDTFHTYTAESKWWDTGKFLPLWISNELSREGGCSGVSMWPGSDVSYRNHTPTHILHFDTSVSWFERMDHAVDWLTDRDCPANLIYMYFEEPDSTGHNFGPDSPEVVEAIRRVDNITGYLINRLKTLNLYNSVNLIITSDHGMTSTPVANFIDIDRFLEPGDYRLFGSTPVLNVLPDEGKEDYVYEKFLNASRNSSFTVFRKEDIPDEFHYKNNRRIMPILVMADLHWAISSKSATPWSQATVGNHGYNNSLKEMRPFFLARGPAFVQGQVSPPFLNIDIYRLACYILDIQPQSNNASLDRVAHLLLHPPLSPKNIDSVFVIVVGVALGVSLLVAVFGILYSLRRFKKENAEDEEQRRLITSTSGGGDDA